MDPNLLQFLVLFVFVKARPGSLVFILSQAVYFFNAEVILVELCPRSDSVPLTFLGARLCLHLEDIFVKR